MKAIETKFLGPSNVRGARIIASDLDGNRATISYPHELNSYEAHAAAARALMQKMHWSGDIIGGATKAGYAFVFVDNPPVDPAWCYTCDRPKNDCACVENGGTY